MKIILTILMVLTPLVGNAMEKKAYLKDERIIVETPDSIKSIDFTMERGHRAYELKKYTVKEEIDIVEEALKVFQNKKRPVYNKKVWIYERLEDRSKSYLEFMTNKYNEDIVFSPGGEFVYYQELTPQGEHRVYGVKIGTDDKFFINTANDFYIETCDQNNLSYVITTENGEVSGYHAYNLMGDEVKIKTPITDINDLNKAICY